MKLLKHTFLFLAVLISIIAHAQNGYSPFGDIHWRAPVASVGALPASGNSPGDTRTELTGFTQWVWNGSAWAGTSTPTQIAINSTSANSNFFPVFVSANSTSTQSIDVGPMTYNPFTGALTTTSFVGALTGNVTGTASGNTTYTPNNFGVVVSGSGNTMSVITPNASTVFPLISGGASANPSWAGLTVPGGGTGAATFSAHNVLLGEGASPFALANPSTASYPLMSNTIGSDPSFRQLNLFYGVQGQLPPNNGGTGVQVPTAHGVAIAEGIASFNFIAPGTAGLPLLSGSAADPAYGALSLTTSVSGILPIANGGTNSGSVTISPTATAFSGWDANKNLSAAGFIGLLTSTATAAGNTTLTVGSNTNQLFTGTNTQTVTLPVAATLGNGQAFTIINESTLVVTVQTSGSNVIQAMSTNTVLVVKVANNAGGTNIASWVWEYSPSNQTLPYSTPIGGTGLSSPTLNALLLGNGSNPLSIINPSFPSYPLVSNGANAPSYQPLQLQFGVAGILPAANGGTNDSSPIFWSGFHSTSVISGAAFQSASTSFADFINESATVALTQVNNAGFGIVAGFGANSGSSALAGIIFTPTSSANCYFVKASASVNCNGGTNAHCSIRLIDSNGVVVDSSNLVYSSGITNEFDGVTLSGVYCPATGSAVTLKIQGAMDGTNVIQLNGSFISGQHVIDWSIFKIH